MILEIICTTAIIIAAIAVFSTIAIIAWAILTERNDE
jgi:hypothetical protein